MFSQPSDQSSPSFSSDLGSTQDPDWIQPKHDELIASSTDNSEDGGWIYDDSFEESIGKVQDNVDFYLGCLDKIEEDYKVENYLTQEVEDSLVETDEAFEEEGKTAQGVDRTETAVVVAIRVSPPVSVPGKVNSPVSIPNAVNLPASVTDVVNSPASNPDIVNPPVFIPDTLNPPEFIPDTVRPPASIPGAANHPAFVPDGVMVGRGEDAGQLDQEHGDLLNVGEVVARKTTKKRINMRNVFEDPEVYVRQQVPKNTKKSTSYTMNLFNSTMDEVAKEMKFDYQDLKNVSVENLP